ncbi:MAG: hypothetical protein R2882_12315 [Gemmatimonadales bacterium]
MVTRYDSRGRFDANFGADGFLTFPREAGTVDGMYPRIFFDSQRLVWLVSALNPEAIGTPSRVRVSLFNESGRPFQGGPALNELRTPPGSSITVNEVVDLAGTESRLRTGSAGPLNDLLMCLGRTINSCTLVDPIRGFDPAFGRSGWLTNYPSCEYEYYYPAVHWHDDKLYWAFDPPEDNEPRARCRSRTAGREIVVRRYAEDGLVDPSFGGGHGVPLPMPRGAYSNAALAAVEVQVDRQGRIIVLYIDDQFPNDVVQLARLLPSGAVDQSFGASGVVDLGTLRDSWIRLRLSLNAGDQILVARDDRVTRFNVDGSIDRTLGVDGTLRTPGPTDLIKAVKHDALGRIYILTGLNDPRSARLHRYLPNGTPDPSFRSSGVLAHRAATEGVVEILDFDLDGASENPAIFVLAREVLR